MSKRIFFIAVVFSVCAPMSVLANVVVNEVAWMGTSESSANEWIELLNNGSENVSLDGWILSIEGKKDIALSGSINAGGLYLIERTDDSTVPNISADLIASFGSGLSNTGAILSLKDAGGVIVDRIDGSNEWKIAGVEAGNNTTKETAQRGVSEWFTGIPTPRAQNIASGAPQATQTTSGGSNSTQNNVAQQNLSTFPVEPQIFADAGASTRTVSVGASLVFSGRVWGLKKEPIENARMVWTFGDGARAEGISVSHTFYYPGEYTVVLDTSSGYYSASDRMRVVAVTPLVVLHTGGTTSRSFVALENQGSDDLDLSGWRIEGAGKEFFIPEHTIVGGKKTLTFASEITGLSTPENTTASLLFPNGTRVLLQNKEEQRVFTTTNIPSSTPEKTVAKVPSNILTHTTQAQTQMASVPNVISSVQELPQLKSVGFWGWGTGVAFLVLFILITLRFVRTKEGSDVDQEAGDFEIIEECERKECSHAKY